MTEQCLLSACALNLKRMVKLLKRRLLQTLYSMFFSLEQLRAEFFEDFSGFVNRTISGRHPMGWCFTTSSLSQYTLSSNSCTRRPRRKDRTHPHQRAAGHDPFRRTSSCKRRASCRGRSRLVCPARTIHYRP